MNDGRRSGDVQHSGAATSPLRRRDAEEAQRRSGRESAGKRTGGVALKVRENGVASEGGAVYVEESAMAAGPRVSLDSIVQCFQDGLPPETILGEFDTLHLAQVYGAITYYLENRPAVDAYRVRQELGFAGIRRTADTGSFNVSRSHCLTATFRGHRPAKLLQPYRRVRHTPARADSPRRRCDWG